MAGSDVGYNYFACPSWVEHMKKIVTFLLVVFLLSACRSELLAADQLPWVGDGQVLFKDDFSTRTGGWITQDNRLNFSGYDAGGFRLWTDIPNYQVWSVPGLNFKDALIFTRTTKLGGPDNNIFGLLCRYQDDDNFYAFMISSDGYYGIFRNLEGRQSLIDQPFMQFSEVIHRGEEINRIVGVCQSNQLQLIVNDLVLITVQDDALTYGDVGLIAGSFSDPGVDILFNEFFVLQP